MLRGAASWAAAADPAAMFGAREDIQDISLSPSGTRLAFLAPGPGQGTALFTVNLTGDRTPVRALSASGNPDRLSGCYWVSDDRLLCRVYGITSLGNVRVDYSRLIALDADGKNFKVVSFKQNDHSLSLALKGGQVVDLLPGEDGAVLLSREYVPENDMGRLIAQRKTGIGVDRVDTRTLVSRAVEQPNKNAGVFISDGRGDVRIMGAPTENGGQGYSTGTVKYVYRTKENRQWLPLGDYNYSTREGFDPAAVDRDCNCVYGFKKLDGRKALYRATLDASKQMELVLSRPDVDVDGLITIGRAQRVVGATFATDRREAVYFDPQIKALTAALSKALPGLPLIDIVDADLAEDKLLLRAGSDVDPGRYYVFDKTTRHLDEIMLSRTVLDGTPMARQEAITYRAADGTMVPGYLTLPPGGARKGLPAIVMPHGGPASRDEWGFDWLAQYLANRGYAVLQPNFRGSSGYGDAWFKDNGFRSWRLAIGDVNDAGRWLVSSGVADASKLAILGWSYGGYAALQAAATEPNLFHAVVAIAPVTDLQSLKDQHRSFNDYEIVAAEVGSGAQLVEASPAQHAAAITAPVLMFHGDQDVNVDVAQSRIMAGRMKDAGKPAELIVFPGLDHQLQDSGARTEMLRKTDSFLRAALRLP